MIEHGALDMPEYSTSDCGTASVSGDSFQQARPGCKLNFVLLVFRPSRA